MSAAAASVLAAGSTFDAAPREATLAPATTAEALETAAHAAETAPLLALATASAASSAAATRANADRAVAADAAAAAWEAEATAAAWIDVAATAAERRSLGDDYSVAEYDGRDDHGGNGDRDCDNHGRAASAVSLAQLVLVEVGDYTSPGASPAAPPLPSPGQTPRCSSSLSLTSLSFPKPPAETVLNIAGGARAQAKKKFDLAPLLAPVGPAVNRQGKKLQSWVRARQEEWEQGRFFEARGEWIKTAVKGQEQWLKQVGESGQAVGRTWQDEWEQGRFFEARGEWATGKLQEVRLFVGQLRDQVQTLFRDNNGEAGSSGGGTGGDGDRGGRLPSSPASSSAAAVAAATAPRKPTLGPNSAFEALRWLG